MPIRKPAGLITGAERKEQRTRRVARERSMTPKTKIHRKPPHELDGHPAAQSIWRRTVKVYSELKAQIATALDQDHLVDYCLASEELADIGDDVRRLRGKIQKLEKRLSRLRNADLRDEAKAELGCANKLLITLLGRLDRKRKLCMAMRHDLYLTPRSRAGAAPTEKPKDPPKDPMEELLNGNV
jgi:phage terminase small subunit